MKEALHRMANVLNLDANVDQSSSSNLTETIEPLESKKVVFPQLEKAESNVISVKINTENKNEKIILPNSLIKDLNAKALMNSVHVKSVAEVAFEPTVVADNSVTALAKNESPTNMQVESANDEANEAIVIKSKNDDVDLKNEFSLKINRKDVPTNDGVFVKEKSEIPLKVNKTEQPFFENKQNIETPKPNEAVKLVVNNDAIEITEEAMLKIEVKAQVQTQTIDTVKQVSKIPEKAIEGNVPIVPQVYKSDEAEKSNSIVLQRKSFKEKITSANQESVVEMKHQGFEIKGSQIAPAGRLQEHVKQAVLAFDDGVFQDKVSTLEAKDSEISGLDVSQMILDRMVENSENNLEPLEMPVVENEKASLDNMISDKKSIVAPDSHRQDILERINQVVVVQKLIRKVQVQKLITEGVVQLRIDPPELGQLLLKMTVRNNEVSLHITSENQQAKDLILNQKHVFVQNMREAGLDVKTIEVHVGKESSSDFSRESGQQAQQQKFRQPQQAPKFFREEIKMDVDVVKETQQHVNKTHLNMIA